jgi:hypothetical protein
VPTIDVVSPARLGSNLQIELAAALPNSIAVETLGFGSLEVPIGGGCTVLTSAVLSNAVLTGPVGRVSQFTAIPNNLALVGLSLFSQFAVLDPNGAFAAFLALTAGAEARVGI